MTDIAGIISSYRKGLISDEDMAEVCKDLPEVAEALAEMRASQR